MRTYTVKSGDTLSGIAKTFLGNGNLYMEIAKLNNIPDPSKIQVGMVLKIPDDGESGAQEEVASPAAAASATTTSQASSAPGEQVTAAQLKEIMPNASDDNITLYLPGLNDQMAKFEINTSLRQAQFIAQIAHESGSLRYNTENLNYSAKALLAVFGKYFPTQEEADAYARQPEKIASRVYANRMGNGDEASGDGWKFRGRGLIQLTGHDNYQQLTNAFDQDFISNPDPVADNPEYAVGAATWFWDSRDLNTYADQDDIRAITKRINGGYNGLEDREEFLARAKSVLM